MFLVVSEGNHQTKRPSRISGRPKEFIVIDFLLLLLHLLLLLLILLLLLLFLLPQLLLFYSPPGTKCLKPSGN